MKSFTSVLVAGFAALAQAVQLTNSNFDVQAGQPFTITWSDAQGPVTLTLKNGPSTNLVTVQTITSGQTGTSFTWTPSSTLPTDQYAIEISDASGTPNYSGQFTLTTDVTASASVSSAASTASGTITTTVAASTITTSASLTSASTSAESSAVSSAANSTTAASTVSTSTRASTRTSATSGSTAAPTTVPGSDSARIGSPIALIGLTVAAMLYFQ